MTSQKTSNTPPAHQENFSAADVSRYISELRQKGHHLKYDEYALVQGWIEACKGDTTRLMLILEELIPSWLEKQEGKSIQTHLKGLNKRVLSALAD